MHFGDAGCARVLQAGAAALLPVFDHVETHLAGPTHAALHETEVEARIAPHQTAEENSPRKRVVRFGEVADVVVGKVGDRGTVLPAAAARMLSHGDAELDAPAPERLVVIGTVERDGVAVPGGFLPVFGFFRRARNRSFLISPQHRSEERRVGKECGFGWLLDY